MTPRRRGFGDIVLVLGPQTGPAIRYHVRRCFPSWLGVSFTEQRVPLGTAHAVLCARKHVGDGPFAVVNSDDVYGAPAMTLLAGQLAEGDEHAIVSYRLRDTIVTDAPVTRGTCEVGPDGHLVRLVERRGVARRPDGTFDVGDGLEPGVLPGDTPVSMNLWGFQPSIWPVLETAVLGAHPSVSPDGTVPDPAALSERRRGAPARGGGRHDRGPDGCAPGTPRCACSTDRAAASASPTPTTSPWCATSSPSWWRRDFVPRVPGTRRLSPPRAADSAPTPWHPNRRCCLGPARTGAAPDGRRVPDREPVERLDAALAPQGYRLEVTTTPCAWSAPTRPACATGGPPWPSCATAPTQPAAAGDRTLPACRIEDWPDFAVRGVMLDVSRDRVPSMPTLRDLVDRLAGWKINQLQLYMEHTFAYAGHEDVWRHADPYTADDMRRPRRPLPVAGGGARRQPEHTGTLRAMAPAGPVPAARHRARRLRLGLRDPPPPAHARPRQARGVRARLGPARPARPPPREHTRAHRHGRALGAQLRAAR